MSKKEHGSENLNISEENKIIDKNQEPAKVREPQTAYQVRMNPYIIDETDASKPDSMHAKHGNDSRDSVWDYSTGRIKDDCRVGKTIEDYIKLPEGAPVELIDGVFYDMAAPTTIHQSIAIRISNAFMNHIKANGGSCVPFIAPTDVQIDRDDKSMVQPDVMIVCDRKKITEERIVGAPDLIVEIVSPSNWYKDVIIKLEKYRHAGVREYWIVQPELKQILVYPFERMGEPRAVSASDYTGPYILKDKIQPVEYSFEQKVPVGIWNGACEVDFAEIYKDISYLYQDGDDTHEDGTKGRNRT